MKRRIGQLLAFQSLLSIAACSGRTHGRSDAGSTPIERRNTGKLNTTEGKEHPVKTSADLILKISAEARGGVGYGLVYSCNVKEIVKGKLGQSTILLTLLAQDKGNIDFFARHESPAMVEAGFKRNVEGEPYPMAAISDFVDEEKTSWILTYVK